LDHSLEARGRNLKGRSSIPRVQVGTSLSLHAGNDSKEAPSTRRGFCFLQLQPAIDRSASVCNLYSDDLDSGVDAQARAGVQRQLGNLPPLPGIYPNYLAPVVILPVLPA